MASLLSVRDLAIAYRSRRGPVQAVRGVSFNVAPGESVAIILFQLSLVWLASALEDIFNPRLRSSG